MADAADLARRLMRCPSITPIDAGAMAVIEDALDPLGFHLRRYRFGETENLHAWRGEGSPCLVFAGHTDVVPPGALDGWSADPFAAEIRDGILIGRGAVDMKGGIAAFIAALADFCAEGFPCEGGTVALLITGDEEADGDDGMRRLLPAVAGNGFHMDHCLVGEPTSRERVGDTIKNGRRGSLNAVVTATGKQGHVAYPREAANPLPALVSCLGAIAGPLDDGAPGFEPSNVEVTAIDAVNPVTNLIPARATARLNIRFNTRHDGAALTRMLEREAREHSDGGVRIDVVTYPCAEPFLTPPGEFVDLVRRACAAETGFEADLGTGGGTSDARHIRRYCEVVELGPRHETAHAMDEHVPLADLETLTRVYRRILGDYFSSPPSESS